MSIAKISWRSRSFQGMCRVLKVFECKHRSSWSIIYTELLGRESVYSYTQVPFLDVIFWASPQIYIFSFIIFDIYVRVRLINCIQMYI
jgi:hypothetical protein